jgi:hypothetical protein
MQLEQVIRRLGARMSAGLAQLRSRGRTEPLELPFNVTLAQRFALILPALILLYYLLGALLSHKIDADPRFDIPAEARLAGDSYAVGLAIGLLDREVNHNGWVANSPFYLPTALLHNMASFQTGIVESITSFAASLSAVLKTHGANSDDLDATVDKLSKRPDVWSWDWSEPWGYLGNSESEYREGLLDLQGYNVALTDGSAILPKDVLALALILRSFARELQKAAAALDQEAQARPMVLSRRLGDAFYRARGLAYCELVLLKGLKTDFAPLIAERGLGADLVRLDGALRRVALFSPLFVLNGAPDSVIVPSHPLIQSYYTLDAERALQALIAKLG